MDFWTITIQGTFSNRIGVHTNTEAEARQEALDKFEELYSVADDEQEQYYWDKVKIVKVEKGFLD
jgi:hypothetical protein